MKFEIVFYHSAPADALGIQASLPLAHAARVVESYTAILRELTEDAHLKGTALRSRPGYRYLTIGPVTAVFTAEPPDDGKVRVVRITRNHRWTPPQPTNGEPSPPAPGD